MLEELKERVCKSNLDLVKNGLVVLTWGNASAISQDRKYIVIKPSGLDYSVMTPSDMVVTDIEGHIVEGKLRPSSDLKTHLELYKAFDKINAVVHTHSTHATALAQTENGLQCFGTTHADSFYGMVPCTRYLTDSEIAEDYEMNTGKVIIETFKEMKLEPEAVPAVLVCKHGPFTWGSSVEKAVENAIVLEEVCHMAFISKTFDEKVEAAPQYLMDKHYFRKHGKNAYYGQK